MTAKDRATVVCRDCGEVTHHSLAGVRPTTMLACGACGLLTDPTRFMGPPVNLGLLGSAGRAPPERRAPARARPRA